MRRPLALALMAACSGPDPDPGTDTDVPLPCRPGTGAVLELSHHDSAWGALSDGDPLYYGHPPQGGAPYSPFQVRLLDVPDADLGVVIETSAVEVGTGEVLGSGTYTERLICSNAGENEGWWVGAEVHMRYFGWELDELEGRRARVRVSVRWSEDEAPLDEGYEGVLTRMPDP